MNRAAFQLHLSTNLPDLFNEADIGFDMIPVAGGSLNETYRIITRSHRTVFVKINSAKKFPQLFNLEKQGLDLLSSTKAVRCPKVLHAGEFDDYQVLAMEWVEEGNRSKAFWENFGANLAALHCHTDKDFGLPNDNYMGVLYQTNSRRRSWTEFFYECRLNPQIELAKKSGHISPRDTASFENLNNRLSEIFDDEKPALLHGDLWSGNFLCDSNEQAVLIDPAVYFGHRCMDLAMTKLFGGFDNRFYESYDHHFPFPKNYREQWDICNLYPLLIHLNLFGSSYLKSIREILKRFQ